MAKIKAIYLIEFDNGGIKVGISDNFNERLMNYTLPWCRPIIKAGYLKCQYPRSVETKVIRNYKRNISNGSNEFIYNIPFSHLQAFIINNKESKPLSTFTDSYWQNQEWVEVNSKLISLPISIKLAM